MKEITLFFILFSINTLNVSGQYFERQNFSVVSTTGETFRNGYHGAAWADFNKDGYPDLVSSPGYLYLSDGKGGFLQTYVDSTYVANFNINLHPGGISVADFDNDGYLDCFISGVPSRLFRGIKEGRFAMVETGVFADKKNLLPGWAVGFADVDNDAFVEALITHPAGFIQQVDTSASFFLNNQKGLMVLNGSFGFTKDWAPYTVATWGDYDDDGDQDLFIGNGPAFKLGRDSLLKNMTTETQGNQLFGPSDLSFAEDQQNGQVYTLVDVDNDRDLDIALTNYRKAPNHLYINNNGHFEEKHTAFTIDGTALTNAWGDIDNDGDLDLIITNDRRGRINAYLNDGQGNFTYENSIMGELAGAVGLCFSDYNLDGQLDFYTTGWGLSRSLYKNVHQNDHSWVQFDLRGTNSNAAAIGAKVEVLARIRGRQVWQRRDISAQNSFNGQHDLRVHFGLGDAKKVQQLIIRWPSGMVEKINQLEVGKIYKVTEGKGISNP